MASSSGESIRDARAIHSSRSVSSLPSTKPANLLTSALLYPHSEAWRIRCPLNGLGLGCVVEGGEEEGGGERTVWPPLLA